MRDQLPCHVSRRQVRTSYSPRTRANKRGARRARPLSRSRPAKVRDVLLLTHFAAYAFAKLYLSGLNRTSRGWGLSFGWGGGGPKCGSRSRPLGSLPDRPAEFDGPYLSSVGKEVRLIRPFWFAAPFLRTGGDDTRAPNRLQSRRGLLRSR